MRLHAQSSTLYLKQHNNFNIIAQYKPSYSHSEVHCWKPVGYAFRVSHVTRAVFLRPSLQTPRYHFKPHTQLSDMIVTTCSHLWLFSCPFGYFHKFRTTLQRLKHSFLRSEKVQIALPQGPKPLSNCPYQANTSSKVFKTDGNNEVTIVGYTVLHLQGWRWRQNVLPNRWYLPRSPHSVTTHMTNTDP
jgi:hypothetical protein